MSCEYCRCYSSKQVERMASVSTQALSISVSSEPTMLISCSLQCLPLHSTQNKAKCSTPSCPWSLALSLHRPSFGNQAFQVPPAIIAYNNACRLYSIARGEGCTSSKKLVLLRRRGDVLLGTS